MSLGVPKVFVKPYRKIPIKIDDIAMEIKPNTCVNLWGIILPEINFELCQKYSNKYKSLIGKDISVYTFKHTDDMPFAFLIENNWVCVEIKCIWKYE